jgi:cobalamin biosynthetic protein CobC
MIDNIELRISQHGGNLSYIAQKFPDAPRPFIDLSTGINPYAYPFTEPGGEAAGRLADAVEMEQCRAKAAAYYGAKPENINIAAGMQPLLFALASLRFQKSGAAKVMVLSPTYSEYENIWQAAGHNVSNVASIGEVSEGEVAVICNPNNPDGRVFAPEILLQIADNLAQKGGWLVVDEAFADLTPQVSVASFASGRKNLIVMRSCGKFFGIAGLRVSSAVAPAEISGWLSVVVGAWPIATPVCRDLPAMFEDYGWIERTRTRLESEAASWRAIIARHFTIVGYTSLFTLVETDDADFWHKRLAAHGILTRKFSYNKFWLRFGLPDSKYLLRLENIFMKEI